MGKRSINAMNLPALFDPVQHGLIAKRSRLPSTQNSAALTLLALKQEPLIAISSVWGKDEQLNRCDSVTFDRRQRSPSLCSSVTDDELESGSIQGVPGSTTTSRRFTSVLPSGSHPLLKMALTRPNLCLVDKASSAQFLTSPSSITLPEGRPLQAPPRLPTGIVFASRAESLVEEKAV